ncbi:neuropeptide receptor 15 [Biomphalaria pfeifferi]|uniref:Neuropeptide receptor 15 n=1 Tax=Biomphalaria pfeifferi TaxID=112525 RepID=A0AAD8AY79_BIOPF|nr:neuropeptide receptor 15 [Biomphalaria pfeifferi]
MYYATVNESNEITEVSVKSGVTTKPVISVTEFVPLEIFVTSDQRRIAEIVLDFTIAFVIAYIGVVTNAIVIAVFVKQGLKDSVAVSMTVIAVWDFFKCIGGAAQRMAGPISLVSQVAAKSWINISVVVFNYFISFSSYVASVLAAYVAVERCLCVSMPFKVKELITPKVALFFCLLISFVVFGCFMVMFFVYDIDFVYSDVYNATLAIYLNNDFFYRNSGPLFKYYNLSGIIWPTSSLGIVAGSTAIIAYHLKKSSHFRSRASCVKNTDNYTEKHKAKNSSDDHLSARDRQVVKMLLVVIGVNVLTLSPRIVHYMVKYFIYEFYFLRAYHNLFLCITYILAVFDLTNAAFNVFIFYQMSTAFRKTFWEIFSCGKK